QSPVRFCEPRHRQPDQSAGTGAKTAAGGRAGARRVGANLETYSRRHGRICSGYSCLATKESRMPGTKPGMSPGSMSMRLGLALGITASTLCAWRARAQDEYPTHRGRLVAPAGRGGNPDVLGRLLAEKSTAMFGKPFIVENAPGAGGIVAANMVVKAPPDGHVLIFGDSGNMAINPALNPG